MIRKILQSAAYLCVLSGGFFAVTLLRGPAAASPVVDLEPPVGQEIAIVLLVSTSCAWSNHPDLLVAWNRIVQKTTAALPNSISRVRLIGVVAAPSPAAGYEFLSAFGEFDEMSIGWRFNNGMLRYIDTDFRGEAAYPQVLIVRRDFAYREDWSVHRRSEVVLQRLVGIEAINALTRRGS